MSSAHSLTNDEEVSEDDVGAGSSGAGIGIGGGGVEPRLADDLPAQRVVRLRGDEEQHHFGPAGLLCLSVCVCQATAIGRGREGVLVLQVATRVFVVDQEVTLSVEHVLAPTREQLSVSVLLLFFLFSFSFLFYLPLLLFLISYSQARASENLIGIKHFNYSEPNQLVDE